MWHQCLLYYTRKWKGWLHCSYRNLAMRVGYKRSAIPSACSTINHCNELAMESSFIEEYNATRPIVRLLLLSLWPPSVDDKVMSCPTLRPIILPRACRMDTVVSAESRTLSRQYLIKGRKPTQVV
ncbi:hypothetical protein XELAEV_18015835mg [Xenopus laevis]|uniref:Uncharacterized protein n=1 Tax=Xenopus laevis TaxID=8355 RepID=A0A974DKQ6_XENLA|nr:hypothetical protein XELAEV_18015835mg [Xenopus laevis]